MSDSARVIAFLTTQTEAQLAAALGPQSSLIQSGLLDSLALFQLSLWIEDEIGHPLELGTIEIASAWDTPDAIAGFIRRERARSP